MNSKNILGGITTFLTMSYIVIVNPSILSTSGTGLPFSGVLTATVLVCFLCTLLMGLYAKLPYGVAPGMGINAFFTFSIILGQKVPWPVALGMIVWAGILFLLISVTPLRMIIAQGIPQNLRIASAVGIGLFLTLIGFKNAGIIVSDPVTFVKMGTLNAQTLLSLGGMALALFLYRRESPLAFLASILAVTLSALALGWVKPPEAVLSWPDFHSVMWKFDLMGALKPALLPAIVGIFFTDLFDSISTFVGVAHAADLLDEKGEPLRLKEGLIVDAIATFFAGVVGSSSGTAYIESMAGIKAGGRSGAAAVVTALCFLPCLFIAPLAALVPAYATAPILIIVGALMFASVKELKLVNLEDSVPAFLTVALIPLTFSISQGIIWGFLSHTLLYLLAGKRSQISPVMWVLSMISIALLVFH